MGSVLGQRALLFVGLPSWFGADRKHGVAGLIRALTEAPMRPLRRHTFRGPY